MSAICTKLLGQITYVKCSFDLESVLIEDLCGEERLEILHSTGSEVVNQYLLFIMLETCQIWILAS